MEKKFNLQGYNNIHSLVHVFYHLLKEVQITLTLLNSNKLQKRGFLIKKLMLFSSLLFIGINEMNGQISENFQSWTSKSSYAGALSQIGSGGTWTAVTNAVIVEPTGVASGTGSIGYVEIAPSYGLEFPNIASGGVGNVTIQARASSASGGSFTLEKNVNNTGWVIVNTFTSVTDTGASYLANVNVVSANIQLRITNSSSIILYLYDLSTTICTPPVITSQPLQANQDLCLNNTPFPLSVTATAGSGTISTYQWYNNSTPSNSSGNPTPVGTNSSSISPITSVTGIKYYYVIVTNSNGCSVTSGFSGKVTVKQMSSTTPIYHE